MTPDLHMLGQHEQQQDDHTHSQEDHIHSSYQPRQRCEKLQSLHAEFHITSLIDAYLALGKVGVYTLIDNMYMRVLGHVTQVLN